MILSFEKKLFTGFLTSLILLIFLAIFSCISLQPVIKQSQYIIIAIVILITIAGGIFLFSFYYFINKNFRSWKISENQLKLSENKFANSFNYSGIGKAIVSTEGKFLEVNTALSAMLGYGKEEMLLFTFQDLTYPDDLELDLQSLNKILAGEIDTYQMEKRYIHKGGHLIWARLVVSIVREANTPKYFISQMTDITATKTLIESLRLKHKEVEHHEKQLRIFIEDSPASICMVDKNMNFIVASKVWLANYNVNVEYLPGRNFYQYFPNLESKWTERHKTALKGKTVGSAGEEYINQKGDIEWIKWQFKPWYQTEEEIGGIILSADIVTEEHKAIQDLIKAKLDAEQATRIKSEFLSTMSHEIRTPLNAVMGFTGLLYENATEDQLEYIKLLKFSAENLMVLINDILDFNKIEAGKINFEELTFNLKELMHNVIGGLKIQADDKAIPLIFVQDPNLPEEVVGDPVRLAQVLTNLLSNAVKFTEQGEVTISVALLSNNQDSQLIQFKVTDTGIGIPEDKQNAIFDSFTQASSDTTRKYGGTGLGLSISKNLLKLQGSDIKLKSTPGKGSEFQFELAFKRSSETASQTLKTTRTINTSLHGVRILLVEDNKINTLLAMKFLVKWNAECDAAENGLIAVEKVQKKQFDIILMDLQMPEMDGYEAAKAIRELTGETYQKIPIIALTANVTEDIKEKALAAGMNDTVIKPFNPLELFDKIKFHMES